MRINTNVAALNSYNQLNNTNNNLSKSLERLSSGKRINGAADDAAGLAISEKMNSQTRGLAQAQRNSQDGISMIQTAEGALKETHSILQRMRELSVQAANDTNTNEDRAEIQNEINQLNDEIDRIGNTTEFNTKKLLNGNISVATSSNNDSLNVENTTTDTKDGVYSVDYSNIATKASVGNVDTAVSALTQDATVNVNGTEIDLLQNDNAGDVVDKINNKSEATGVTATVGDNGGIKLVSNERGADQKIDVTASNQTMRELGLVDNSGADMDTTTTSLSDVGTDSTGFINGAEADSDGTGLSLVNTDNNAEGLSTDLSVKENAGTESFVFDNSNGPSTFTINGTDVEIAKGTDIDTAVDQINERSSELGVTASKDSNGELQLASNIKGEDAEFDVTYQQSYSFEYTSDAADADISLQGVLADGSAGAATVATITGGSDIDAAITTINADSGTTGVQASKSDDGNSIVLESVGLNSESGTNQVVVANGTAQTASVLGATVGTYAQNSEAAQSVEGSIDETVGTSATSTSNSISIADTDSTSLSTLGTFGATDTFTVQGTTADGTSGESKEYTVGSLTLDGLASAINADSDTTGVKAEISGTASDYTIELSSVDTGADASLTVTDGTGTPIADNGLTTGTIQNGNNGSADGSVTVSNENVLSFQIGANENQNMNIDIKDMRSESLGVSNIDVTTAEGAGEAISTIDEAIGNVSSERSKLGAFQNRLDHTINNLNTSEENLTAAESRISDVDMAREMMNMSKQQILSQAGTAMLAQANQLPQGVLQLLG
ncbi:flagellin [Halanaerobium sp.]|uniref:flagellin N-terminal helical domain-containing protein n=1 Tax=Halanaerobium sp. TaxID=1895664 RepID=UPI000DE79F18|nr:flagellin [Halanaerobium sp.]PUU88175.1 MAG: flagellin [Halanaerobium sp.]